LTVNTLINKALVMEVPWFDNNSLA